MEPKGDTVEGSSIFTGSQWVSPAYGFSAKLNQEPCSEWYYLAIYILLRKQVSMNKCGKLSDRGFDISPTPIHFHAEFADLCHGT